VRTSLFLLVGLCVAAGAASAREAPRQELTIVEDGCGTTDAEVVLGHFGVAQAGTTWIGWKPGGSIGWNGVWDFDDRGLSSCPIENDHDEYLKNGAYAQGWTSEDAFGQKGLYWHAEDFAEPGFACSPSPISGGYSAWCGRVAAAPGECFTDAPGYGHNWDQWLCRTVTLDPVTPRLRYMFTSHTEPDYDYAYVFIDAEYPDSCGWIGDLGDTLRCCDGQKPVTVVDIDLSNPAADPDLCDNVTASDYSGDSVKICFVVVSDGAWDDEDGIYDTCDGALTVDDIFIDTAPSSGDSVVSDFETGTLEGWERCAGWSAGDYAAIRHRSSFVNHDVCGFDNCGMEDCVLAFWNPNIGGQYGNGGHYNGDFHKRAWSPAIDMSPYPHRGYVMRFDMYGDLPIPNWIFYRYYCSYVQDPGCPAGSWSPPISDNYVYYSPYPRCRERQWGFSQFVPANAESVKIGVSVWAGCEVWCVPCTNGNETPIFDNVQLGVWDLSSPQASMRAVDNYTDSWPEHDTLVLPAEISSWGPPPETICAPGAAGNTALIDVADNRSQTGAFLRLGDSLAISLNAPDIYAELCFRIRPGPCTDLSDPFFTAKYPDAGGWSNCELSDDYFCTRMDTAFAAGDGDTLSQYQHQVTFEGFYASMIHEDDPLYMGEGEEVFPDSLFTPGTEIYYAIRTSYLPGPGPYSWLPYGADMGDPATLYEVAVLPDRCEINSEMACLLYVDYYNRGAQAPIEAALAALGRDWDRMDLRAESSRQGNGIGNRLLGAGRYRLDRGSIGPSNDHLQQYSVMLINSGHFGSGVVFSDGGTGMPDDPTNDVGFLDQWINEGRAKGLWLSGDALAADFSAASSGPKPAFLSGTLGAALIAPSYRDFVGHSSDRSAACRALNTKYGRTAGDNYWDSWDTIFLGESACPRLRDYDVLDIGSPVGMAGYGLQYDDTHVGFPPGGLAASVYHVFPAANAPHDTVRTLLDGFSLHALRDGSDCGRRYPGSDYWVSMALWLRDVLGNDRGDPCCFYDRVLNVQYCPPLGADAVTGVDRPGRFYSDAMFRNYPNPFRSISGTTIHYSVAKAGLVEVEIFDAAGRLVNTITEQAEPGENFLLWDGRDDNGRRVPSGVYFYELEAGDVRSQRKMVIVD
jgi:hypothetical protein